ncbi:MAG: phosphoribosylamine--glycine ligase [Candidatus Melainabacteria bacterium]|nr:MAG: phosphoribosylamine--glycine ligase [Candidatus Melainabacteria bacterium]
MLSIPNHSLKLLVVGAGGREHALCWKLAQSQSVGKIYCTPGNGGTAQEAKTENLSIDSLDFPALSKFCLAEKIDLVVVGPDNPLAEGIVDALTAKGTRVFGPSRQAARLEWSKSYAKDFLVEHGIPTARHVIARSFEEGKLLIKQHDWARVVKVDGLALGKGVFVCDSEDQAEAALQEIFTTNKFGAASETVVLEEKIVGEELSLLLLCDGKRFLELESSQDHKRRFDDDQGPNTGGMGAYSPVPLYAQHREKIQKTIIAPLGLALAQGKLAYQGLLYIGIIVGKTASDDTTIPRVLEFNARFGDPEAQAILPRLKSDLLPALWATTEGKLDEVELSWAEQPSCCVVAVTKTYPEKSAKGDEIQLTKLPENCAIFHSGTQNVNGKLVTAGGRILSVTALGLDRQSAAQRAYQALAGIKFDQMDYRRDIARERSICR